jgi:ABC-2 type transport system ATP-binding protein
MSEDLPFRLERGEQPLIELRSVTKQFRSRVALDAFSIAIDRGTVVGVLGPNGAGKTTMISIAAGLTRPTSGTVHWDGEQLASPFPPSLRRDIGMVTQETSLYSELTVRQNLRFAADLFGVRSKDRVDEILELVGLDDRAKDPAGELSGGMQRRLGLARALLHDPAFLVLDEPTLGVDVEARHALWGHIRSLRRAGKTALISTNQLDEAEALCDRIVVLREGKQIAEGTPLELLSRTGRLVEIDCADAAIPAMKDRLSAITGFRRIDVTDVGLTVHVEHGHSADEFAAVGLASDDVQGVRVRAPDMVEVFQALAEAGSA